MSGGTCAGCGTSISASRGGRPRKWCGERCRKDSYAGTCIQCGGRTDGTRGSVRATVCRSCINWARDSCLLAVAEFFAEHDRPPTCTDTRTVKSLPDESAAARLFGSWCEMIVAAGLPLVVDRRSETQAEIESLALAGVRAEEIAAKFGCTAQNVYLRLRRRGIYLSEIAQPRYDALCRQIVDLYRSGLTPAEVAVEVQRHAHTVDYWLKKADEPRLSYGCQHWDRERRASELRSLRGVAA